MNYDDSKFLKALIFLVVMLPSAFAEDASISGLEPCITDPNETVTPLRQDVEGSCGTLMTYNKDTGLYDNKCAIGGPINPANGEVYLTHLPDFTLRSEGSEITLFRTYRSYLKDSGVLGNGWRLNFEEHLVLPTGKSHDSVE